jgi:cytosine deaminase
MTALLTHNFFMTHDLLIQSAQLTDGRLVDIGIGAGVVQAIYPANSSENVVTATTILPANGNVLMPGLVDAHVHLDKTYVPMTNHSGTLEEAVQVWFAGRPQLSKADAIARASRAIECAISHGTTAMRTHINVVDRQDLEMVEATLEVRERYKQVITLQTVALGLAGASQSRDEMMDVALRMGVDIVGSAPSFAPDKTAALQAAFRLAAQFGKTLDLHIDENNNPQSGELEQMAELTIAYGLQGQVVAGHCCSLSFMNEVDAGRVMDKVAAAGIHIIALPSCNLVLQGRNQFPAPRGVTRVKELLARGVNVSAASDNVRDPFNPFGNYDVLSAAYISAHTTHMTGTDELNLTREMVTAHPRLAMGLPACSVAVGAPADFVLLDSNDQQDAVLCPPYRLATVKAGKLIYKAEIRREWFMCP